LVDVRFTVVAASALALLFSFTTSASGSATPTRFWYTLKIVYIGSSNSDVLFGDGGKTTFQMKSAFVGTPDTAVLVRSKPGGSLTILGSTISGHVTRFESDTTQDYFVGTHAPCKEHVHETLKGSPLLEGTFGVSPGSRPGRTAFGISIAATLRTVMEEFAVAPCAGSIKGRPVELLNEPAVKRGERPEYLVKGRTQDNSGNSALAMTYMNPGKRRNPEERTVGKFGQRSFSVISHVVVQDGPRNMGSGVFSNHVDETWFFNFTRCPGTAPC
jgi:hypothetical protein